MVSWGAVILVTISLYYSQGQVIDQTRISKAVGSQVVEAVINLIHESCIFPDDRLYLRRIAYVETRDGLSNSTFRAGYYGGIWQVDESQFQMTKTAAVLAEARKNILATMGIDWSNVAWTDLTKPLYSGLAASLYTLLNAGTNGIPSRAENQGTFWINHTRHTQAEAHDFFAAVSQLESGCKRSNNLDLVFVLDSSASLSTSDLDTAKQFVRDVVGQFDVAPDKVRVAVVEYSTAVAASFFLNKYQSKAEVQKAVEGITYNPGGTNTATALTFTVDNVFAESNGARKGAARVLILITDGRSDNTRQTEDAANVAKQKGITLFTIGVTPQADKYELSKIASLPTCTHTQLLNAFSDLDGLKNEIQRVSCTAPAILPPSNYTFACGNDVTVQILPDLKAGSTVTITVTEGKVSIYGSLTSSNPSQVLNEFSKVADIRAPITFYVRGNHSVSLALVSSEANSCTSNFHVDVEKGNTIRPTSSLLCIDAGLVIKNCSATTLFKSPYMIVAPPYPAGIDATCKNPNQIEIYEYPTSNDRFIYCDGKGNVFVVLCPVREIFDIAYVACVPGTQMTYTIMVSTHTPPPVVTPTPSAPVGIGVNPCTPEHISAGLFFFPYVGNERAYIECYNLPYVAIVKFCEEHHYWDQDTLACLYKPLVVDPTQETYHLGIGKPCGTVPDLFFYELPGDRTKYIHCDQYGDAFEKTCPDNKIWSQNILQCVPSGVYVDTLGQPIAVGKR